jgi:hypothetical protein
VHRITLTNNGAEAIASDISIVFDGLPATATLYTIAGSTLCGARGRPDVDLSASGVGRLGGIGCTIHRHIRNPDYQHEPDHRRKRRPVGAASRVGRPLQVYSTAVCRQPRVSCGRAVVHDSYHHLLV